MPSPNSNPRSVIGTVADSAGTIRPFKKMRMRGSKLHETYIGEIMDRHSGGTVRLRDLPTAAAAHRAPRRSIRLMAPWWFLALPSTGGCVSLWPTANAHVQASQADVRSCATTQARELGYRVSPDTTHGSVTAEKTVPFRDYGPDVTVYSIRNVLAVALESDGA